MTFLYRWLLNRGDRLGRFDCITLYKKSNGITNFFTLLVWFQLFPLSRRVLYFKGIFFLQNNYPNGHTLILLIWVGEGLGTHSPYIKLLPIVFLKYCGVSKFVCIADNGWYIHTCICHCWIDLNLNLLSW
jgi:hypothetical protein